MSAGHGALDSHSMHSSYYVRNEVPSRDMQNMRVGAYVPIVHASLPQTHHKKLDRRREQGCEEDGRKADAARIGKDVAPWLGLVGDVLKVAVVLRSERERARGSLLQVCR